jgi:hypothetical protein
MTEQQEQHYKARLLMLMPQHIGKSKTIGMGELFEAVFGEPYAHRINDTKRLRRIITSLRQEGVPICSSASRFSGGYYLASAGSELADYCGKLRRQGLRKLWLEASIRKISLAELVGQLRLDLEVAE